jgi:hypothetical protein
MGDGSMFSVDISRVPLQGICRMGRRFQEGTQNQAEACDKIHYSRRNTESGRGM